MPRINHLKIRKLGNVAPGTELKFGPRGAILLGRNGTGKTTLLDTLVSIARCDFRTLSESDYDIDFMMTCADDIELRVTVTSERAKAGTPADFTSDPVADAVFSSFQDRLRRQTIRIEALHKKSGELTTIESTDNETKCTLPNGDFTTTTNSPHEGWDLLLLGVAVDDKLTPLWRAFLELLLLNNMIRRFDEGLDYFRDLTERGPDSAHIESFKTSHGEHGVDYSQTRLIPHDYAHLLLKDFRTNRDQSSGFIHSSQVAYLDLFCRLAGFAKARIGADLDEKRQVEDREVISLSPLRFSMERNGSVLHHRHLSFGQRRLLAFLHYRESTPTLLMVDELVNGMHYEWIAECIHLMRDAQAFLSSQNPLLFDFLTFESAEDVASRFVSCDLDEQHHFVWRNMSDSDAVEFYETYKVGLQHVSEILRTRGYW